MLLAQCGYGKAQKIEKGMQDGSIQGAILSPRDERPDRLAQFATLIRQEFSDAVLLFDPQFYAATLTDPRDGHLPEYPYYAGNTGLGRAQFGARSISQYVRASLDFQNDAISHLDYLMSPTVFFEDFQDSWSQVAFSMADASAEYHRTLSDPPPLLISLAIADSAFHNTVAMNEFLDSLSTLDIAGFYLLFGGYDSPQRLRIDPDVLSWQTYFVHVLTVFNEYEVFSGYTDWFGTLFAAAGASAIACGWHQSLRRFSLSRFQPATGGRRPRRRYSSSPLLSNPLIQPELEDIHRAGLLTEVLSGTQYDSVIAQGPAAAETAWTDELSCLAHWASVASVVNTITQSQGTLARATELRQLLGRALDIYAQFDEHGVAIEAPTGPAHLEAMTQAVETFLAELEQ